MKLFRSLLRNSAWILRKSLWKPASPTTWVPIHWTPSELMMEFEKSFNLSIPDDQQENIQTVGDVVKLIEKMRAENN